jgi:hypothetical protein|tara:strand:- start:39 stop:206 length:168 start_codon:yes stop_codon:yes gene_type:complete
MNDSYDGLPTSMRSKIWELIEETSAHQDDSRMCRLIEKELDVINRKIFNYFNEED